MEFRGIPLTKANIGIRFNPAFHASDPAIFRTDNGDWLFFNKHFSRITIQHRLRFYPSHPLIGFDKLPPHGFYASSNNRPLAAFICHHGIQIRLFGLQIITLFTQFHFFQFSQRSEPHIKNGICLIFIKPEPFHQTWSGVVFFTDNGNYLIQIKIYYQIAFQHFQPNSDLAQPVL